MSATSSNDAAVRTLAYKARGATLLWLANLTTAEQTVAIRHAGSAAYASVLDESSFERAVTEPRAFQGSAKALAKPQVKLGAYAVAIVAIND